MQHVSVCAACLLDLALIALHLLQQVQTLLLQLVLLLENEPTKQLVLQPGLNEQTSGAFRM